jgi:hypothetical protein
MKEYHLPPNNASSRQPREAEPTRAEAPPYFIRPAEVIDRLMRMRLFVLGYSSREISTMTVEEAERIIRAAEKGGR